MTEQNKCIFSNCKAVDYREAFSVSDDGSSFTLYEDEVVKHNHPIPIIYKGLDLEVGIKDNMIQIWEKEKE